MITWIARSIRRLMATRRAGILVAMVMMTTTAATRRRGLQHDFLGHAGLVALVVESDADATSAHLILIHDFHGASRVRHQLEFNGAHAERAALLLEYFTVDDVAHFGAEQVLQIGPAHVIRYVAHVDRLLPAVFEAHLAIHLAYGVAHAAATRIARVFAAAAARACVLRGARVAVAVAVAVT